MFFKRSNKYKLSQDDLSWQPYKGGEVLTFQSNTGELDTIFVNPKIIRETKPFGSDWRIFPDKFESICVLVKSSDPNPPKGTNHRYIESCILKITKTIEANECWIQFLFTAKDAWFYDNSRNKSELIKLQKNNLNTKNKNYDDVIIIKPRNSKYESRINNIEKLYWSLSEGYIRYDLKDNKYWELISKNTDYNKV